MKISVFEFDAENCREYQPQTVEECFAAQDNNDHVKWIDIAGFDAEAVHKICAHYEIHYLLEEDIRSHNQRPKIDEQENIVFFLLYMLRSCEAPEGEPEIEKEQISIALGNNFILSFQDEADKDAFASVRNSIRNKNPRVLSKKADFLCYMMLDAIVDDYQNLIERFGDKIEAQEDELLMNKDLSLALPKLSRLRKELFLLRRNIIPVREIINAVLRNNSPALINKKILKYYKDIYDHILQSQDILESYHDSMSNLHDLYLNKENLKMNESMNIMAIVTCLLAPASMIGGVFGMNFEHIPFLHDRYSFYIVLGLLTAIFISMIIYFRKKKWL